MKKGLLLFLAALMTLGVSVKAMASARLDGMATTGVVVEDRDLIFTFPNKALTYGNLVDIRFIGPSATGIWGGLLVKDDSLGVIGAYANNPGAAPLATSAAADPKFDLFWAKDFTGATFGAHVNYANTVTTIPGDYVREMGLQVGLGLTSDQFSQVNISAGFDTVSGSAAGTSIPNEPSQITLDGLVQKDVDSNNDLRLAAGVNILSNNNGANTSTFGINLDGAANRKVMDGKGLVSTGLLIGFANNNLGGGVSNSEYTLDWQANLEAQVESWLTVRTGLDKTIYDGQNQNGNGMAFAMGASVNWQNFVLDLNVDPASVANSITNVEPGRGIFFFNGNIVTVTEADITYKF